MRAARALLGHGGAPGTRRASREAVLWGYRLLLGREPESRAAIDQKVARAITLDELRQELTQSEEFRASSPAGLCHVALTGREPPLPIELAADLDPLFAHIQRSWEHLGATEPHWSVVTFNEYRADRIGETGGRFYDSGKLELEVFLKTLERNGVDRAALASCQEYGCGVGRVTLWLAQTFPAVTGLDISRTHLEVARRELDARGVGNVELRHLAEPRDIKALPPTDVVYSIIVLQHNPPPVIAFMVRRMIASLRPGGVAFFQVPTYRAGYRFSAAAYLREDATPQQMEMHVLPQAEVFRIVDEEGGRVLEVLEDGSDGLRAGNRSNIFLVRKLP